MFHNPNASNLEKDILISIQQEVIDKLETELLEAKEKIQKLQETIIKIVR